MIRNDSVSQAPDNIVKDAQYTVLSPVLLVALELGTASRPPKGPKPVQINRGCTDFENKACLKHTGCPFEKEIHCQFNPLAGVRNPLKF